MNRFLVSVALSRDIPGTIFEKPQRIFTNALHRRRAAAALYRTILRRSITENKSRIRCAILLRELQLFCRKGALWHSALLCSRSVRDGSTLFEQATGVPMDL